MGNIKTTTGTPLSTFNIFLHYLNYTFHSFGIMHLIKKITCVVLTGYYLQSSAFAQVLNAGGIVYNKSSSVRISQAIITDLKSRVVMISDDLGRFSIKTALGDTLLITKESYTSQKIVIANVNDLVIYMQPVIKLNEVTIKGKTNKQELNEIVNSYRSKGLYFDGKPPIGVFNPISGSPLTGFHELLGKDAADERRFIRFSKNEKEAIEIDKRYTKELVKSITKLLDDEITKFMDEFRPSNTDINKWNDYQLINYIKKSLAAYSNK